MNSKKDNAIEKVLSEFVNFANLSLQQLDLLEKLMCSFNPSDPSEIIVEMKMNENQMDKYEVTISEQIINTIALYQPVASDIRKLMACYRMIINMERIGDLVMNIVYKLRKMKDPQIFKNSSGLIDNMLIQSRDMVNKSLLSFSETNKDYAIWTIKNDEVVDVLKTELLKKSIIRKELPKDQEEMLLSFIDLKGILSSIERIADHATNIAEASIYSMEGNDIRHQDMK